MAGNKQTFITRKWAVWITTTSALESPIDKFGFEVCDSTAMGHASSMEAFHSYS